MKNHVFKGVQSGSGGISDRMNVPGRRIEFDYLRACAVVLVLFHHAIHAYTLFATINLENPIATATPVVNEGRWPIFDLLVLYNETFLMPLLFFVSGLFVWGSLGKKGSRRFLADRLTRLGLPFLVGIVFLMPLAYYPALLQVGRITGGDSSYGAFWLEMVRNCFGTAGPLWFLWLLLAFNSLAALLFRAAPDLGELIRTRSGIILSSPGAFFGVLLGISLAAYLPGAIFIGPQEWVGIGPFQAQISRVFLYLVYFLGGTGIGACGIDRTLFRSDGPFARQPLRWLILGLISYSVLAVMIAVVTPLQRTLVSEMAFVLCGGATVLGLIGLFQRYAKRRTAVLDSLSANSYGIYFVHYLFVTWLQYFLLGSTLAPSLKGFLVFGGTLALSWGTAAALRRLPAVANVI